MSTLDRTPTAPQPTGLDALLDAIEPGDRVERVTIADLLSAVGGRSFPALILMPAVLLVSPISGVPGTPTLGAAVIVLLTVQALAGRRHLWLPGMLMRRSVSADRLRRGLTWLRRPARFMDRLSQDRLRLLTTPPLRLLAYFATLAVALSWPVLELLPFVTSFGAGAVSMIMFGLMTRDGLFVALGYAQGAALYLGLLSLGAEMF